MRRKLFNLVSLLSLLLFIAIAGLWVWSYRLTEAYAWNRMTDPAAYHESALLSGRGVLQYTREDTGYPSMGIRRMGYQSLTRPFELVSTMESG